MFTIVSANEQFDSSIISLYISTPCTFPFLLILTKITSYINPLPYQSSIAIYYNILLILAPTQTLKDHYFLIINTQYYY